MAKIFMRLCGDDNFRDQMHMYYRFKNADAAK